MSTLDRHYPTVDFPFIRQQILACQEVLPESELIIGRTTTFVLAGKRPIFKRTIIIRQIEEGQVNYMQATGLAIRLDFMGALLKWLEDNKHWKDGGYFVPAPQAEV